ncbi:hypothetical protein ACFOSP_17770, partial [Clostridium punense]
MRVNNYSALNKIMYDDFRNRQSRLIESINKAVYKKLNILPSNTLANGLSTDTLSIVAGKLILENQKKLASIGKNAEELVAKNNVLDLRKGAY